MLILKNKLDSEVALINSYILHCCVAFNGYILFHYQALYTYYSNSNIRSLAINTYFYTSANITIDSL